MGFTSKLPLSAFIEHNSEYELTIAKEKLKQGHDSKDLKKLKQACMDFEAIFIEKLWNEMKKTLPKGGLFGDKILENYLSIFDMEFAEAIAKKGGIGISDFLYENLKSTLEQRSREVEPDISSNSLYPPLTRHNKESLEKIKAPHKVKGSSKEHHESFLLPVEGKITSHFGWRVDPFSHRWAWHNGIDISAPIGTPVKSVMAGKVIFAAKRGGYGNLVMIKHNNGLVTCYAHLNKIYVKPQSIVKKGSVLGEVGRSGRATGPHLHFEIRFKDMAIDPEHIKTELANLGIDLDNLT